jgi:hypothetical protein
MSMLSWGVGVEHKEKEKKKEKKGGSKSKGSKGKPKSRVRTKGKDKQKSSKTKEKDSKDSKDKEREPTSEDDEEKEQRGSYSSSSSASSTSFTPSNTPAPTSLDEFLPLTPPWYSHSSLPTFIAPQTEFSAPSPPSSPRWVPLFLVVGRGSVSPCLTVARVVAFAACRLHGSQVASPVSLPSSPHLLSTPTGMSTSRSPSVNRRDMRDSKDKDAQQRDPMLGCVTIHELKKKEKKVWKGWEAPLLIAIRRGYLDIVRILLDGDADINVYTHSGKTPLEVAVKRGTTYSALPCTGPLN